MKSLNFAIIGAGPAGLYFAKSLLSKSFPSKVKVDVFEKLAFPNGLLRYGVAPDHFSIKNV